jgi:hypothetical protein
LTPMRPTAVVSRFFPPPLVAIMILFFDELLTRQVTLIKF